MRPLLFPDGTVRLTVTVKWSPGSVNATHIFFCDHLIDATELGVCRYWKCKEIDHSERSANNQRDLNWPHLTGPGKLKEFLERNRIG